MNQLRCQTGMIKRMVMGFSKSLTAKCRGAFPDRFSLCASVSSVVKKVYGGLCRANVPYIYHSRQTAERHLTARSRAGNRLMTEKVFLRAQNAHKTSGRAWRKMAENVVTTWRFMAGFVVARGGKWRTLSKQCGGKWRTLSQRVADYGGFCRSVWRIMADFVVSR